MPSVQSVANLPDESTHFYQRLPASIRDLPDTLRSTALQGAHSRHLEKSEDPRRTKRLSSVRTLWRDVSYGAYKNAERPGVRHRWFRNFRLQDWQNFYGRRYMYSSDYIHSNPKQFAPAIGHMARTANRLEEWAELSFRYTGCYCRFLGGLSRRSLREVTGFPRFERRLKGHFFNAFAARRSSAGLVQLQSQADYAHADRLIRQLVLNMRKEKHLNFKAAIVPPLTHTMLAKHLDALATDASLHPDCRDLAARLNNSDARDVFIRCLTSSERSQDTAAMSFANKWVLGVGCAMSTLSFAALGIALGAVSGGLYVTYLGKMGMVAATLYLTAFTLRCVTTASARAVRAYRPTTCRIPTTAARDYSTLYEMSAAYLRTCRNRLYAHVQQRLTGRSTPFVASSALDAAGMEREIQKAGEHASLMAKDATLPYPLRKTFASAAAIARATDVVFSLDRITAQLLFSRPIKGALFRYHKNMEFDAGYSTGGKCSANWAFRKAEDNWRGRAARSLASFIGHGGVDCLGMSVGCAACSVTWTTLTEAAGGAILTLAPVGESVAAIGLGFASVCAAGWLAAAATETVAKAEKAVWDRYRYKELQVHAFNANNANNPQPA